MLQCSYAIPDLPPAAELETIRVYKELSVASRALAALKGEAKTIPNQGILIDTLTLQEAKASSEIENIVTTQDELFQSEAFPEDALSPAAKEVSLYRDALRLGYARLRESGGLIPNSALIDMFRMLKRRADDYRTMPGTALINDQTGRVVYVPPQDHASIVKHMSALERFINDDRLCELDPLIKMALIHHQFESIHPFPDGNGRIGRILNVLYLTRTDLLDIPVLYLSGFITRNKNLYYRSLQAVRDEGAWEDWVVFMLKAVTETSTATVQLIIEIREQMKSAKERMRAELPKIYSHDLLNNLFRHPYTRIEYVQTELGVTRQTAAKYLDALAEKGFISKQRAGNHNYYVNVPLVRLFVDSPETKAR